MCRKKHKKLRKAENKAKTLAQLLKIRKKTLSKIEAERS